jgi:molybdenum-dependent DNA-binding transcriptional regulator ModE
MPDTETAKKVIEKAEAYEENLAQALKDKEKKKKKSDNKESESEPTTETQSEDKPPAIL